MCHRCPTNLALRLVVLMWAASGFLWAESGVLVVHVEDVQRRPISGMQIGTEGDGGSAVTGDDGKARIRLAKETKEKSWVSLQILKSAPHKDFVMVSPWDYRAVVPSFENESENFVKVVVVQRGDREALESGTILAALTARINKANAPKTVDKRGPLEDPKANLDAVAKMYGLDSGDLDRAIRSWGDKTTDPYEAGLAALYRRNYPVASARLKDSLQNREAKLAIDQKAVADAAFFLGQSLYWEGKYRESAAAFQRCLQLRQNDTSVLINLGFSLALAGDYAGAEPLLQQALKIDENARGPDNPFVAADLLTLGSVLSYKGDYGGAELLLRRALIINEKALGPDDPSVASILYNLGGVLLDKGEYGDAEQLLRRSLAIREKTLGPDHPCTGASLNSLALLLQDKGDYARAEPLFRRTLAIVQKSLGPDHPDTAASLNNLAALLQLKGDYAGAEPLFRQALAIVVNSLGPDHPTVAACLSNIGQLLAQKGDYAGAEPLSQRALAIVTKALGPDHAHTAVALNNLGLLLQAKGDYTRAEKLFRQALAIQEKTLGPDHPDTAKGLYNLASQLYAEGDYQGADPLLQRALAIDEKTLGTDHPTTQLVRRALRICLNKEHVKKAEK
jgi:tetratricopeptide (TPR) repeat protein